MTREFMLSGWTVRDLHHALDALPDGRTHGHFVGGEWVPYTGADGIPPQRLGHWLRFRLAHWLDGDGQPVEAPSQREARRARTRAQQRAAQQRRREEEAAERRARLASPEGNREKAEALARIHALREQRRSH